MIRRCCNPKQKHYDKYGGRGISVCDHWLASFDNFNADMGARPTLKHTLERVDNDGNYEPGNCKWATKKEQSRNTRTNVNITFNGETMCLSAWAEKVGLDRRTLDYRIRVYKWPLAKALTTHNHVVKMITFNGKTKCLTDWAKELGISLGSLKKRLRKWPIEV